MGVLNVGQRIEEQAEFEKIYKNGTAVCALLSKHVSAVVDGVPSLVSVCDF